MLAEIELGYVTCVGDVNVLGQRLLASPCFGEAKRPLIAHFNAASAAQAFNAAISVCLTPTSSQWMVWVHEDVFLPAGWELRFKSQILEALATWSNIAVVGVYGVAGSGPNARQVGHVLDRGTLLHPAQALPCLVDSLDELLFAVRIDSGLRLDPALAYDFYATDLVLQARANGWECAVVDAYCEHWSRTRQSGPQPLKLIKRIKSSAAVFEAKWVASMPITTTCFHISNPGDVAAFIDTFEVADARPQ